MKQPTVDTNVREGDNFVPKDNEEVLGGEKQGREEGGSCLNTMPLFAFIFSPHQNARPRQRPLSTHPQDKHVAMLRVLLLRFPLPTVLPAQQATSVPPLTTPALLIIAEPL